MKITYPKITPTPRPPKFGDLNPGDVWTIAGAPPEADDSIWMKTVIDPDDRDRPWNSIDLTNGDYVWTDEHDAVRLLTGTFVIEKD